MHILALSGDHVTEKELRSRRRHASVLISSLP